MKKVLFLSTLLFASSSFAAELMNYDDVKTNVQNGNLVRIAVDFSKCTHDGKVVSKPMFQLGVYTPNEVIIANDGSVVANLKHFTMNDTHVPKKAVYQYVTYSVTPDNNVTVSAQVLEAISYVPLTLKHNFVCRLGDGATAYSR